MAATFRAGGLASGMDSNAIIEQLVALRRQPIEKLAATKKAVDVKVSVLGQLASKLEAFNAALASLGTSGARGVQVVREPASVKVTASAEALAGSFSLEVSQLAQAAKARSSAFAAGAVAQGGTLHIEADGEAFDVTIDDGASLGDVAEAIEASGAPVSAAVLNDGTSSYLVLTRTSTGHVIGDDPSTALTITETSTGVLGQPLGLSTVVAAANAQFSIDTLALERRSNDVTDALPGTTLSLTAQTTAPETLVLSNDASATRANLQKVVDAYNAVVSMIQGELALTSDTDRSKTLGGEPALRSIQARMQSLITTEVGTGNVRTLADLGVRSARDGSLTIDEATFNRTFTADPASIDEIIDGGLATAADSVVDAFVDSVDGALTLRTKSLNEQKRRIDDQMAMLEARAEAYRDILIAQYTAMEKVVSSLKAVGNFLSSHNFSIDDGDKK